MENSSLQHKLKRVTNCIVRNVVAQWEFEVESIPTERNISGTLKTSVTEMEGVAMASAEK
jgi:hypothetical protein